MVEDKVVLVFMHIYLFIVLTIIILAVRNLFNKAQLNITKTPETRYSNAFLLLINMIATATLHGITVLRS